MGAGRPDIEASVIGIEWALRISAIINFIMILMVVFGVKGEDAARHAVPYAVRCVMQRPHPHSNTYALPMSVSIMSTALSAMISATTAKQTMCLIRPSAYCPINVRSCV